MSYAQTTFRDANPIKRWLQRQRLLSAIELCKGSKRTRQVVCDFGAGNGELCKLMAKQFEPARLICYEPAPDLLAEARENLRDVRGVEFCDDMRNVVPGSVDLVFCLEIFEHLPPRETTDALRQVHDALRPNGTVVVGVPVEIGLPALYKGLFRMSRRYGAFDANVRNVVASLLLHPPQDRPVAEIAQGMWFHFEHTGFDFRRFRETLAHEFKLRRVSASPFPMLGPWLMPEIYFVAEKA